MLKIRIAFLMHWNDQNIGWTERNYSVYFKYLDTAYFELYPIFVAEVVPENTNWDRVITKDAILETLKELDIHYIYRATARLSKEEWTNLSQSYPVVINVNFTPLYEGEGNFLNCIISLTDYFKIEAIQGKALHNASVTYNPIDVIGWQEYRTKVKTIPEKLKEKKMVIGRIGRAEPSKWNFLILATLWNLDMKKNYDYGFLFAGMPKLYRWFIKSMLSQKMQDSIVILPEQRWLESVGAFYNSIDIFWQTSRIGESFWNVIAEAFSFELPVITDYKDFYNDWKLRPHLYDAQVELVDYDETGYYANFPWVFEKILWTLDDTKIEKLGKWAYKKALALYEWRVGAESLTRILYNHGIDFLGFEKDERFETLNQIPTEEVFKNYKSAHLEKIGICKKENETEKKWSIILYKFFEKIWWWVEFIYLAVRKILKDYAKIDIEVTR